MKHLMLLLSLLWASSVVNAQDGYYFGDKFIELNVNSELSPYKIPTSSSSKLRNKTILSNGYVSQVYQSVNVDRIIVLPKIIVGIKEGGNIDDVISEYGNELSVASNYENTYYLDCNVKTSKEVLALVASLTKCDKVKWCEPDMYSNIKSCNNNPYYSYQYYLKNNYYPGMDINVEPAWDLVTGASNVTVAIVDTGVDLNHEDLKASLLQGYTVGDLTGYGAPKNWTTPNSKGHGTCCAGIVGAIDNNIGVVGVANGVKILPVNIAPNLCTDNNKSGFASNSEIAQAIRWAYPKADVLSCSWGGGSYSNDIVNAITEARTKGRKGKGAIVVFSAGNSYGEVSFPGNVDGVITVGAIRQDGTKCDFSNVGKSLDLVAFGERDEIVTTDFMGSLGYSDGSYNMGFSGTSAACPQVAGVVALMLSANPNLTEEKVKEYLRNTAHDLGEKGRDDFYGYGLVDAYKAVAQSFKGTMYITGPTTVDTKAVYRIKNLPKGCTVKWAQESYSQTSPSLAYLEANEPEENAVTVYNKSGFAIKLVATIHFPNDIVAPDVVSWTISGAAPSLVAFYCEVLADGTKTLENSLVDDTYGEINFASPPNEVIVTSNSFVNRDVYVCRSNESWNRRYVRPIGDQIIFEMPSLESGQTLNFSVEEVGKTLYTFKFAVYNTDFYNNDVSIAGIGNGKYEVKVQNTEDSKVLIVDVVNVITGAKVLSRKMGKNSVIIDASNLDRGCYVIRADVNGKKFDKKIFCE